MQFVEVLVAEATYHGSEALTYCSEIPLQPGRLALVPLRHKQVLGVVVAAVSKPSFAVKPVASVPDIPALPSELLALLTWMRNYYPAPLGITTQLMLPKQLPKQPLACGPLPPIALPELPELTSDQAQALTALQGPGLHLLHGETGSGKTRVYIELAIKALTAGRSAIVLTPEIGLTSQLADSFRRVFGQRVVILHSQLTEAIRARNWQYLLEQPQPMIVIGARSAIFSPLQHLGLIVVDEAHETAYKQDQAPYYHATTIAAKLAELHNATLVLGSATPLVNDYYVAKAKQRPVVRMSELAKGDGGHQTNIQVVDLRTRDHFTKSSYLSSQLLAAMRQALEHREQILLFLNRRGTARVIFCEQCGWEALCPHCGLPLVYHGDNHLMRCHSCDYKAPSPTSCPTCQSTEVIFRSVGTKAIVAEAERLFPEARVMRFDTDNKKSERIEHHYDAVHSGQVDILVGTQTLAKGLDLPRLSLVGVIIADTSLFFPDFSAQERTYQLLTQVVGRIGRGHRASQAVVQTYDPENPLLKAALQRNWNNFYNKELDERRLFTFPPFCYLLKLTCRRASSVAAQRAAEQFIEALRASSRRITIEGPTPAFHEKVQNKYVWQLVIKSKQRSELLAVITHLPAGWSYDIDPMNLL